MSLLLAGIVIAWNAAVAAGVPWVAFRLAVDAGVRPCGAWPCCGEPFRRGWRGWLAVGSRCPACAVRFGAPWWVGAGLGAVGAALLVWRLPSAPRQEVALLVAWLSVLQAGLLLSGIDLMVRRLPTRLVVASAVVVVSLVSVSAVLQATPDRLVAAFAGAAAVGVFYLLLVLVAGSQMGLGDVRVAVVLGLLLGASGWRAVVIGAVLPFVLAVPTAVRRGGLSRHGQHFAFGPFLFAGAIIAAALVG